MVKLSVIGPAFAHFGLFGAVVAQKMYTFPEIPPSTNLTWYPCKENFFCANLDVPLDYAKPNGYRATVPFIKYPAVANSSSGDYQGVLLGNPGGPGNPAIDLFLTDYFLLVGLVGTNWDLVAFDPRGLGHSHPKASCGNSVPYPSPSSTSTASYTSPQDWSSNGAIPKFAEAYYSNFLEYSQAVGKSCQSQIGGPDGAGQHMSTATTARDMAAFLDAFAQTPSGQSINNPTHLNYWGFSYGSFLGMTFANMFPTRIGRVVLDGVVDPVDYANGQGFDSITSTDAAVNTFFDYCHTAGPTACSYYTGSSASDIQKRFDTFIGKLNPQVAYSHNWSNASTIEFALETIKQTLVSAAYMPESLFLALADQLVAFEASLSNFTVASVTAANLAGTDIKNGIEPETSYDLYGAVACSDNGGVFYGKNVQQLQSEISTLESQSAYHGELWATDRVFCAGWSIKAVEIYSGPFGSRATSPMLFVSNTYDPITPLKNGQKWAASYSGSHLLTIDGVGHTSIYANNNCAFRQVATYLQTGSVSKSYCPQEVGAFGVKIDTLNSNGWRRRRGRSL